MDERENKQTSLKNWGDPPETEDTGNMKKNVAVDCGWGRLIFGQTYKNPEKVAEDLRKESEGRRDVAFYVREPHVVLAQEPQLFFLDPSHSFRLNLETFEEETPDITGLKIRKARPGDEKGINRLYSSNGMVPVEDGFVKKQQGDDRITFLVAVDTQSDETIVGAVMGVDHKLSINDPDNGSSLWALGVDPQAKLPGIGGALTVELANRLKAAGRSFMDLSVMHDNEGAIRLYKKLGFERVPVYCVKRKNPINEKLFLGDKSDEGLNIYCRIIVDEARRRGIHVHVDDAKRGFFTLTLGARAISCRESLCDLISAVAMSRCDNKAVTGEVLRAAGLNFPDQIVAGDEAEVKAFLGKYKKVVVKPARGEQGRGVSAGLTRLKEVKKAIREAAVLNEEVLVEAFHKGQDLRIIVIDNDVVAAAVRRPPSIRGDGEHDIETLIRKQSRRRENATEGESRIPMDGETKRRVKEAGYKMDSVLEQGKTIEVRQAANLHTGGTIHDVTRDLHGELRAAAVKAAQALNIQVVGIDMMVKDPSEPDHIIIEANERPGLANHEPAPTAEKFIDFLFPQTKQENI